MKLLKKIGKIILQIGFVLLIVLLLLEMAYRFQWVDFYRAEWSYLNREVQVDVKNDKILVFGDSFSSDSISWVNQFRENSKNTCVYNASMPGVGVETYDVLFDKRVSEVQPDLVLIQLYVGNDVYDYNKPVRWGEFSLSRNLFWSTSNLFRSLNFINYRLGQVSSDISLLDSKENLSFDTSTYASRTKLFIRHIEEYPYESIFLQNDCASEFDKISSKLLDFKERIGKKKMFVIVVPHCAQVDELYRDRYKDMGAITPSKDFTKNIWVEELTELGLNVIDPLPRFQMLESEEIRLYYENDPHLNERGQKELFHCVEQSILNQFNRN